MRSSMRVLAVLVWLILAAPSGLAASFLVSQDGSSGHRTIQGAIDAASFGDTIYVSAGTYEEQVVLRDGITIVGAGSQATTIRNTYGFDEAFTARNISSGRVEGFTMERGSSVLSAPVAVFDDATLTVADCVIRRAQESGVVIRGNASRPTFDRVTVTDNDGHGIEIADQVRVTLRDCRLEANGGSGLVLSGSATATISGGSVSTNDFSGIVVEDESEAVLSETEFSENEAWGAYATDTGRLSLDCCRFEDQGDGAIRAADRSVVDVSDSLAIGGSTGILCEDQSTAEVDGTRFLSVRGVGVRAQDSASLSIRYSEILSCGGDGIALTSDSSIECRRLTILRCGGDGVDIASNDVRLVASIIAMNGGAGIRVSVAGGGLEMSHNNVWGNGEADYVGTTRRPSDISEAPRFQGLGTWNLRLRSDSPGVGDAAGGETLGSQGDPRYVEGATVTFGVKSGGALPWLDGAAGIRMDAATFALDSLDAHGSIGGSAAALSVDARLSSSWGWSAEATASAAWEQSMPGGSFAVSLEAYGLAEDGLPWPVASLEGGGRLTLGHADVAVDYLAEWPTGRTTQHAEVGLGEAWRADLSVSAIDWQWTELILGASARTAVSGGMASLAGSIDVGRAAEVEAAWRGADRGLQVGFTAYLDEPGTYEVGLDWREGGDTQVRFLPRVRMVDASLDELVIAAQTTFAAFDIGLVFGLSAEGEACIEMSFAIDLNRLLTPPSNRLPIASFSYLPLDIETGQCVEFDGSSSNDPDGSIHSAFWDLGEETLAEGLQASHTFVVPGSHRVVLLVTDDDGMTTQIEKTLYVWPADTRPSASFVWAAVSEAGTVLDRSPRGGDRIRLDASASSDADGAIVEYAWDLDSDGVFDVRTEQATLTVNSLGLGEHPVTLRVVDDSQRTRAVMHVISVERAEPPVAGFDVSPATPSILDPISFSDRSTDPDGEIVAWQWSFGDGHSARDPNPTHRYTTDGWYEVSLSVVDDAGQSSRVVRSLRVTRVPEVTPIEDVWAVLIGIADYDEVEDLLYADRDAEAVAGWLLDQGVPASHIRLLTDRAGAAASARLRSEEATLLAVREALGWLRRNATQNDLVVVHFSGHGFQGIDDDGDEDDGVDEFLVLKDSRESAKEDTALRDDEFGRFIDRIESDHVVIFFDSCYSGGQSRSLPDGARPIGGTSDILRDFAMEGRLLLSASSETQEAYESDVLGHGIFTYFLLSGLGGRADENADGRITAWELFSYVAREVPPFVWQERQAVQQPQLAGEGDTRILIGAGRSPSVGFSYAPAIAYADGFVQFRDETSPDSELVSWRWNFGDGGQAEVRHPTHVYREAGIYSVDLVVSLENGQTASYRIELSVEPPGEVQRTDEQAGRIIVSVGARNGVVIGDRFLVFDEAGVDIAELAVVELLDHDAASCEIVRTARPLVAGDLLSAPR